MTPPTPRHDHRALLLFAALVCSGVLLLVVVPPGSEATSAAARPAVVGHAAAAPGGAPSALESAALEVLERGDATRPVSGLDYRFDHATGSPRFALTIEQRMEAREGETRSVVVTRIDALVELELSKDHPERAYARVVEFDVEVEADDRDVALPAVSSLLQGIRVEIALDGVAGIGADVPIAATNPQVKRMISLLVDALRQAHPALPGEGGVGATWTTRSSWDSEADATLAASVVESHELGAVSGDGSVPVTTRIELSLAAASARGEGRGERSARFDPARGRLLESSGQVDYAQRIVDDTGAAVLAEQSRSLRWTVRESE